MVSELAGARFFEAVGGDEGEELMLVGDTFDLEEDLVLKED